VVAVEKEQLPSAFQVEAGAYINAIRSSLDILAATLAQRHCLALIDDAYFPVVASAQIFSGQRYKGHKLVQALPPSERVIIETLKALQGWERPALRAPHVRHRAQASTFARR